MESNVISRPDFQKAEETLSREYNGAVTRRLGRMSIRDFLKGSQESTVDGGQLNEHKENATRESVPSLNEFFDEEDIFKDNEKNSGFTFATLTKLSDENLAELSKMPEKEIEFTLKYGVSPDDEGAVRNIQEQEKQRDRQEEQQNARLEAAKDAMREAIRDSFQEGAREYFQLERAETENEILLRMAIAKAREKNPNSLSTRSEVTDHIRNEMDSVQEQCEILAQSSPEAYAVVHGYEIRKHSQEIQRHEIVTTPYVEDHLSRVEHNMAEGRPTFIHGHLGSGKTELAIMAARHSAVDNAAYAEALKDYEKYRIDNPNISKEERRAELGRLYRKYQSLFGKALQDGDTEATERFAPLIISGSKDLTSQDLYTDKTLKLTKFNGKPLLEHKKDLDALIKTWRVENEDELSKLNSNERAKREREEANKILELYKLKNQAFGTEVETIKQALYRGVEEGRPVIIDEVNAIPAAVLISMNDILQRRPGQTCYIPGAGQTQIKSGFSITMTGNLSSGITEYGGTEDLNPAFLSRLDVIEHDYLPMSEADRGYRNQADPSRNELFQAIMSYMVDRQGNLQLPEMEKSLDGIFALAQLAHATQQIFGGKWQESASGVRTDSGEDVEPRLEKSVLSIRNILNVLKEWDKGSEKDLDKALFDGFISNMTNPDDQNLVLALAKNYGFFRESDGWSVKVKEHGSGFTSLSEIHPEKFDFARKPMETWSVTQVVEAIYGPGPEREIYPEDITLEELDELDDEPTVEDLIETEERLKEITKTVQALEVLNSQCGCPVPGEA